MGIDGAEKYRGTSQRDGTNDRQGVATSRAPRGAPQLSLVGKRREMEAKIRSAAGASQVSPARKRWENESKKSESAGGAAHLLPYKSTKTSPGKALRQLSP